jgi:hypothetical protein
MFFTPDSKLLAALADAKTLGVWDTASGKRIASLSIATPKLAGGAFSPDGRCVALDQNDGTVVLYELASGQVRRTFGIPVTGNKVGLGQLPKTALETRVVFGKDSQMLMHAGPDHVVHVWDVTSGKALAAFAGHSGAINCLALAPDGKTLASASADTTALLWDLTRVRRPAPAQALQPGDLECWWQALAGDDAAKAFDAIRKLSATPQDAVACIQERVQPAPALDLKRVQQLIAQLDDGQFKVRAKATTDLLKVGERLVPVLDKALAGYPSLESERRLKGLRSKLTDVVLQGDRLRVVRAVEVLEHIGTPQARRVLQALADGAPGALVTRSAQAALKR